MRCQFFEFYKSDTQVRMHLWFGFMMISSPKENTPTTAIELRRVSSSTTALAHVFLSNATRTIFNRQQPIFRCWGRDAQMYTYISTCVLVWFQRKRYGAWWRPVLINLSCLYDDVYVYIYVIRYWTRVGDLQTWYIFERTFVIEKNDLRF